MANQISAVLLVEGGIHHAARAALTAGWTQVGRSPDNDIVISDFGKAGTSFALEHRSSGVVLHVADEPITISGRRPLTRGTSKPLIDGSRFRSGGIAFKIEISALDSAPAGPGRSRFGWRLPAVATGVLATFILAALVLFRAAPLAAQRDNTITMTASIPPASNGVLPSSAARQHFALEQLRQHLVAADLGSVVLAEQPDGSIEARGQISKDREAAWREVEPWFDGIAGGQAVLVDAVTVAAEAQPLAIQAVWPGQNPYVIDATGDKLFVGTALPSGWTISSIDRTHVMVKRGDQVLAVRF
jgi:hypothetical protein